MKIKYNSILLLFLFVLGSVSLVSSAESFSKNDNYDICLSLGMLPETVKRDSYITREELLNVIIKLGDLNIDVSTAMKSGYLTTFDGGNDALFENADYFDLYYSIIKINNQDKLKRLSKESQYKSLAYSLKLANSSTEWNSKIKTSDLCDAIMKCFDIPYVLVTSIGKNTTYETKNKIDIFEYIHNIYKIKGQVTANGFSSFSKGSHMLKNEISIDGNVFKISDMSNHFLLGYRVLAFYCFDENTEEKSILSISLNENKEIFIRGRECRSFNKDILTYEKGDKEFKVRIPKNIVKIYNGMVKEEITQNDIKIENGDIVLIDYDTDGTYDVISIMNYTSILVSYVDKDEQKIYDKLGSGILDLSKIENVIFLNDDFSKGNINSIKKDSVIWYAFSEDETLCYVVCSNRQIRGAFTELSDKYAKVNDLEYEMSNIAKEKFKTTQVGSNVIIYLDCDNIILDFVATVGGNKFVYMIDVAESNDMDKTIQMKYFDGEIKVSPIISKVNVDGKTKHNDIISYLKTYSNDLMSIVVDDSDKIFQIDTINHATLEGENTLHSKGEIQLRGSDSKGSCLFKRTYGNFFVNKFCFNDDAKIFVVPKDRTREKGYKLTTPTYFEHDHYYFGIKAYGLNHTAGKAVAGIFDDESTKSTELSSSASIRPLMFLGKSTVLLDNGEIGVQLKLDLTGNTVEYFIQDEEIIKQTNELVMGDLIRVVLDGDEIKDYRKVFDVTQKKVLLEYDKNALGAQHRMIYKIIDDRKENMITMVDVDTFENPECVPVDTVPIMICEFDNGEVKVKKGDGQNLIDRKTSEQYADHIIYQSGYGDPRTIYIYRGLDE